MSPSAMGPQRLLVWTGWLLAVLMVLRPHELVPALAKVRPVVVVSAIAALVLLLRAPWAQVTANPMVRWVVAYLAWAVITMPFALYRGGTVLVLVKMSVFVMLALLMAALPKRSGTVRTFLDGFLAVYLLWAAGVLAVGRQSREIGRIQGLTSYDPNELAALAVMAFGLAVGGLRSPRLRSRVIGVGSMLLSLLLVVKTGSRGGALAAMAVTTGTLLLLRGGWRLAGVASIGVFMLLAVSTPTFRTRLASITEVSSDYNMTSYNGRLELWRRGFGYLIENPVMGVGVNNYMEMEGRKRNETGVRGAWMNAHNMFVQVGAELGFVGLGIFLGMLLSAFRSAVRCWRARGAPAAHPEVLLAMVGQLIAGMFISMAYAEPLIFTVVIATAAGAEWYATAPMAVPGGNRPARWVGRGRGLWGRVRGSSGAPVGPLPTAP